MNKLGMLAAGLMVAGMITLAPAVMAHCGTCGVGDADHKAEAKKECTYSKKKCDKDASECTDADKAACKAKCDAAKKACGSDKKSGCTKADAAGDEV